MEQNVFSDILINYQMIIIMMRSLLFFFTLLLNSFVAVAPYFFIFKFAILCITHMHTEAKWKFANDHIVLLSLGFSFVVVVVGGAVSHVFFFNSLFLSVECLFV